MNQKSSLRKILQFVSQALTANTNTMSRVKPLLYMRFSQAEFWCGRRAFKDIKIQSGHEATVR